MRRRVVGREHILSFNPAPLDDAAAWIAAQQAMWQQRFDVLEAVLAAENAGMERTTSAHTGDQT